MTGTETKEAMLKIANALASEYGERMISLDRSAKYERKALSIAKQCVTNAGFDLDIENAPFLDRTTKVQGKEFRAIDEYKPTYNSLSGDDRASFAVFVFSTVWERECMNGWKTDLLRAEQENDAERAFVAKCHIGVYEDLLQKWQSFWDENGCVPCEVYR